MVLQKQEPGGWEEEAVRKFYRNFHKFGPVWKKVAKDVKPAKSPSQCEALYRQHENFLALPSNPQLEAAFVAMVKDLFKSQKEESLTNSAKQNTADIATAATENESAVGGVASTPITNQRSRRAPRVRSGYQSAAIISSPAETRGKVTKGKAAASSPQKSKGTKSVPSPAAPPPTAHQARTPDTSHHDLRRKRHRKLFTEDEAEEKDDESPKKTWQGQAHDDVGDGVDALMTLAQASNTLTARGPPRDNGPAHAGPMSTRSSQAAFNNTGRGTPSKLGSPSRAGRSRTNPTEVPSPSTFARSPLRSVTPRRGSFTVTRSGLRRGGGEEGDDMDDLVAVRTPRNMKALNTPTRVSSSTLMNYSAQRQQLASPFSLRTGGSHRGAEHEDMDLRAGTSGGGLLSPSRFFRSPMGTRSPGSASRRHFRTLLGRTRRQHSGDSDGLLGDDVGSPSLDLPSLTSPDACVQPRGMFTPSSPWASMLGKRGSPHLGNSAAAGGEPPGKRASSSSPAIAPDSATMAQVQALLQSLPGIYPSDEYVQSLHPSPSAAEPSYPYVGQMLTAMILSNSAFLEQQRNVPGYDLPPAPLLMYNSPNPYNMAEGSQQPASVASSSQPPMGSQMPLSLGSQHPVTAPRLPPPPKVRPPGPVPHFPLPFVSGGGGAGAAMSALPMLSTPSMHHSANAQARASLAGPSTPSGSHQAGGVLPPRTRPRKALPEKLPPMTPVLKNLVLRSGAPGSSISSPLFSTPREDDESVPLANRLRHNLSSRLRRWAMAEFHTSAMDRPWLLVNELHQLLAALGLSALTRLTRTEWAMMRGAFGRPRRLSLQFLKEERMRLEGYRERVRRKYEDLGPAINDLPSDMPRPLVVGQEVTARHPITRMMHDGVILTVKPSRYRVQFNRSELMTEMVRDVDVMPRNPHDNLPLSMGHVDRLLNGFSGPSDPNAKRKPLTVTRTSRPSVSRGGSYTTSNPTGAELSPRALASSDDGPTPGDVDLLDHITVWLKQREEVMGQLRQIGGEKSDDEQRASFLARLEELGTCLEQAVSKLSSAAQNLVTAAMAHPPTVPVPPSPPAKAAVPEVEVPEPMPTPAPAPSQQDIALALVKEAMEEARLTVVACRAQPRPLFRELAGSAPSTAPQPVSVPVASVATSAPVATPNQPGAASAAEPVKTVSTAPAESSTAKLEKPDEDKPAANGSTTEGDASVTKSEEAGDRPSSNDTSPVEGKLKPATSAVSSIALPSSSARDDAASMRTSNMENEWLGSTITAAVGTLLAVQRCVNGTTPVPVIELAMDAAVAALAPRCEANTRFIQEIAKSMQELKAQITRVC